MNITVKFNDTYDEVNLKFDCNFLQQFLKKILVNFLLIYLTRSHF